MKGSREGEENSRGQANNSQLCFVNEQVLPFGWPPSRLSFFTVCPYLKFPKAFFSFLFDFWLLSTLEPAPNAFVISIFFSVYKFIIRIM